MLDNIQKQLLKEVADLYKMPKGAYNIRANGEKVARNTTENIDIVTKEDKPGIDIIIKAGTKSPYSLYNESIASFKTGDLYDHHDAEGFINLFGLSSKVRAMKMQEVANNK